MANSIKLLSRAAPRLITSRSYSGLWTADNVIRSPYNDVTIPNTSLPEHVFQNIDKWADKTALVCGITNRSYTYHQLYKHSRIFAANLRSKLSITNGDVISIMMHNSPEYALAAFGILQAGAEMTTINPIYTAHEVQRQLEHSKPKLIIVSNETIEVIRTALKLIEQDIPIINVDNDTDAIKFQELIEDNYMDLDILKGVNRKSEDTALLPYSSGTTGLPKGVELTDRNLVANCVQQDVDGVKQYRDTTSTDQSSVLAVLPFYHIYGLSLACFHKLSVGAKIVTLPRFKPDTFLRAMVEQKISLLYAAPPMVLFMGAHPDLKSVHLDYLENLISGAAPLPRQDILNVLEKKPSLNFLQAYGLTETSPLATTTQPGSNYTTVGHGIPNTELRVVDGNMKSLGPEEVGELLIKGPQVMKGYRNNVEATRNSITEDGWFKSGDLAAIDEHGVVTIADRLKELIKVKGYQVPPAELENILKEHPSVLDAGVIGIPDQRLGEVPKAFVVLKEGKTAQQEDILSFVKERVAEFKRIKEVMFLDSLPKNPSGKLLRRVLKEKYC